MSFLGDAFSPSPPSKPAGAPAPPAAPPKAGQELLSPPAPSTGISASIAPAIPALATHPDQAQPQASEAPVEKPVVMVSPRAAQEFRRIVEEQKLPAGTGLRLGVQGGGCSGFSYKLGFETMKAPLDWEGESAGVPIYVDPKSFLYLSGVELDFQDSLMGRGFVFNNPNAKKTCGCGESFQV
jgi:iron-sulfur cluster assembly protein